MKDLQTRKKMENGEGKMENGKWRMDNSQLSTFNSQLSKVEWKALGELGELVRGSGLPKSDFTEHGIPAIHYGQIYTFYGLSTKSTISFVSPETATSLKKVNAGDVIITNTSENFEDVATPLVYFGKEQAVTGGHATIFKPSTSVLSMYFAYFTQTPEFNKAKRKLAKGTKVIDVSAKDMSKIKIPIPCPDNPEKSLEIQAEIVRILDTFTSLTAELTAELNMRKKQYNYYRDKLLDFDKIENGEGKMENGKKVENGEGRMENSQFSTLNSQLNKVEWKALGEVADIYDSLHQTPKYSETGFSMIRVTDIKGGLVNLDETLKVNNEVFKVFTKKYLPKKFDLVMSRVGSYGNIGIVPLDNVACMGQNTVVIHPRINNRYLFHFLMSQTAQSFIERNVGGGNQKTLSLKSIKAIPIPIIKEKEQARIVAILDKFDTLTHSISEGLPREIELRQKQYEYYRDLLLSFPKTESQVEA